MRKKRNNSLKKNVLPILLLVFLPLQLKRKKRAKK